MGFFNDFGKSVADAGNVAVQKSKTAAETMKITNAMNKQNKLIETIYMEIGKKYVELHAGEPEADYIEEFQKLSQAKANVEILQRKLDKLKGNLKCPYCGAAVPVSCKFCPSCGKSLGNEEDF